VRAAGLEWRDYDRFMQKFVKRIGDERLSKIPRDLDTKPYRDEHDDDLLRRMLACVDKGEVPKGFRRQQLKNAASTIRQYLRRHHAPGARRAEAIRGKAPAKRKVSGSSKAGRPKNLPLSPPAAGPIAQRRSDGGELRQAAGPAAPATADKRGVTRMQPHIHESVPCRLVFQLQTYCCIAVNRRFGPRLCGKGSV
jgi:hypothetical protein